MKRILVPTDFTSDTLLAFSIACSIARFQSAELLILHVVDPARCSVGDHDDDELNRDSVLFETCWNQFLRLTDSAKGIPVALQVKIGQPVEQNIEVAERECCNMIVIAAHCQPCHHRHIYGGAAESLMRRVHCPVAHLSQTPFRQERPLLLDGLRRTMGTDAALQETSTSGKQHSRIRN